MELRRHGRYDYSPIIERPVYDWPGDRRLAVYLALNIEHFSFGEGLGHTPTMLGTEPDVRNFSWREYGLRVGIWRIFELLDELGLPACHLMNTSIYDFAPQIPARIRARGDEFVGHGRTNTEQQGDFDENGERALIEEVTTAFQANEGDGPGGWMGPWISEGLTTPDLLKESGYRYIMDWSCDDQPVWMRTRAGKLLNGQRLANLSPEERCRTGQSLYSWNLQHCLHWVATHAQRSVRSNSLGCHPCSSIPEMLPPHRGVILCCGQRQGPELL